MNTITEFINMQWVASFGWSLLHTLWQGAIVAIITIAILRFIPIAKSSLRYAIVLGAISTIVILFIGTFIYLEVRQSTGSAILIEQSIQQQTPPLETLLNTPTVKEIIIPIVSKVGVFLNTHIYKIIIFWLMGISLLFTRLIGAFWYIGKIKRGSSLVSGTVLEHLNLLAYQMRIPQWIDLAENPSIHSPIVIGIFKPIILVPVGMLTGLSSEQLASIFIHELTHIKRHDYLVNLIQSIVEVVLFFNPFVMMLSSLLRKERENCCDDVVLDRLKNPTLYAKTLAQLEEYKYTNNQLAISFSGNKNYLLYRIKRIMEHTAKKQNRKRRFLPIILLLVGVTCASWLSFSPTAQEKKQQKNSGDVKEVLAISTQPDTIPTIKEPVFPTPVEPIEEEYLQLDIDEPFALDLAVEPIDLALDMTTLPSIALAPIEISPLDTLPEVYWEKFGEKFSEKFNEEYLAHAEIIKESMQELEKKLSQIQREEMISKEVQEKIQRIEKIQQEKLQKMEKVYKREVLEKQEIQMREIEEKMQAIKKVQKEKISGLAERMKVFEKTINGYTTELKEELVKDGYIKEGDDISINRKNGDLEINGKKIKEKDQKKYWDLQEKHFKDSGIKINW